MSTYVIGDVQGCFSSLQTLLKACDFNSAKDKLWFVGDLVNRGPESLQTLRFVRDLGERAVVVLGNHDLHLLGVWAGHRKVHHSDTLAPILEAPDCDELMQWLLHRPMAHFEHGVLMVHAGCGRGGRWKRPCFMHRNWKRPCAAPITNGCSRICMDRYLQHGQMI